MSKISGLVRLEGAPEAIRWSGGEQWCREDGMLRVAFSGILLNMRELQGQGSAAAVGGLYAKHGVEAFGKLNGPFVIAILDLAGPRPILILARDPHGRKSLFHAIGPDGTIAFSEDLNELRPLGRGVDPQALSEYLSLGYIPAPRTIHKGVSKVNGGHAIVYRGATPEDKTYWAPVFLPKQTLKYAEAVEKARALLNTALKRCLAVERDCGVLLSGGIDSNVMLGLSHEALGSAPMSFTIGFAHSGYDERQLASLSAVKIGSEHIMQQAEPADFAKVMPSLMSAAGEPFADSSLMATALAMRLAGTQMRFVLSGDGGDELFGGYRRYQVMAMRALIGKGLTRLGGSMASLALKCLPHDTEQRTGLSNVRRLAAALALPPVPCYASFQEIFPANELKKLCPGLDGQFVPYLQQWQRIFDDSTGLDDVERVNKIDLLSYVPDDGARKNVLAATGTDVTALAPILDMDVTQFALSLPRSYRVTTHARKPILKTIGEDFMPAELLHQVKRGFGVPVAAWLRGELADTVRDLSATVKNWDSEGWFYPAEIERLANEHLSGNGEHGARLWTLLCLKMWLEAR